MEANSWIGKNIMTPPRFNRFARWLAFGLAALCLPACSPPTDEEESDEVEWPADLPVAAEVLRTKDRKEDGLTDVAVWRNPQGEPLLFMSASSEDYIAVANPFTGEFIKKIGKEGEKLGRFDRPYAVAPAGNYLFVAERYNQRVQVLELPSYKPVFEFGKGDLDKPYGLEVIEGAEGFEVFVADNYSLPDDPNFDRRILQQRIKHYRVDPQADPPSAQLIRAFGEVDNEDGQLEDIQFITADATRNRLYICDKEAKDVKVYDLEGNFTGLTFGHDVIERRPGGVEIIEDESAPEGGYLLLVDATRDHTLIHVYSREATQYLGRFTGSPQIERSEGIAVLPTDQPPFTGAALYLIHKERRVHAYSWAEALDALRRAPNPKGTDDSDDDDDDQEGDDAGPAAETVPAAEDAPTTS